MNTVINNDVANRLQEISAELAKTISADTESVWRLRDISRKLALWFLTVNDISISHYLI